jgi:hypothetical protein
MMGGRIGFHDAYPTLLIQIKFGRGSPITIKGPT